MAKANTNKNKKNQKKTFTPREKRVEVTEITYSSPITVGELAEKLHRNSSELIKVLFMLGNMVTINSQLDDDTVELLCMEFNVKVTKEVVVDESDLEEELKENDDDEASLSQA